MSAPRTFNRHAQARADLGLSLDHCASELEVPAYSIAPDAQLERKRVLQLLSVLSPEQGTAIVLHHVLGLGVAELAQREGIPAETVRSRLRVAMQKLRQCARARRFRATDSR